MHTSYHALPDVGPFPSNGLIVETGDGLLLIDTAWNDEQTAEIAQWAEDTRGSRIARLIVTHAHADKMGGVAALHERGVQTYASARTNAAAAGRDLVPTRETLDLDDHDLTSFADGAVEVFYPGAGHTEDNIVVYVRDAKILFGGCLVRPGNSSSLGNTADADVDHWDQAVENVRERYGTAEVVVPSHGPPSGVELLGHTIAAVHEHRAKTTR